MELKQLLRNVDIARFYPEQKEKWSIVYPGIFANKVIKQIKLDKMNNELILYEKNHKGFVDSMSKNYAEALKKRTDFLPHTTYFLKYSDQTENEGIEMMRYNREKKVREKVITATAIRIPVVGGHSEALNIEFEKTEVIHYGCGPSANAIFNIKNKLENEIWYKTEVVEIGSKKRAVYFIKEWQGKLNVGHGMCSGAFIFNRKGKYKVRFTPMNTYKNI